MVKEKAEDRKDVVQKNRTSEQVSEKQGPKKKSDIDKEEKRKSKPSQDGESKVESKAKASEEFSSEDTKKEDKFKEELKDVKKKKERIGILNIYTSFNNTIMNLTDLAGKSLAKYSGGQSTKQDRLKANPTIAMFVAQKIAEDARENGITGFYVKIRAATSQNNPGPGAHAALKSLTRAGFKILGIMETTRIPRGGPKKPGGRRGRRV